MPSYRFFGLHLAGDAPTERKFFNDQVAMGWALRMTDAGGVEVWEGSRFVARLHAAAPPNSAA
jgi:hypothetical protein